MNGPTSEPQNGQKEAGSLSLADEVRLHYATRSEVQELLQPLLERMAFLEGARDSTR